MAVRSGLVPRRSFSVLSIPAVSSLLHSYIVCSVTLRHIENGRLNLN
jgi:hypothetical protein